MRANNGLYEYIAVYVDDLAITTRNPQEILDTLTQQYQFQLKGTGSISFHLGIDFFCDEEDVLCFAPKKYIQKMTDSYFQMFGTHPQTTFHSPLEPGDHPELDDSEFLDAEDIQCYQFMIGSLQWAISIGRLDITTAVMTLSSFRSAPCKGPLEHPKRIYGYLTCMKDAVIHIHVTEPDYSDLPGQIED